MRLWGKIKGTEADYYIAEGTADAPQLDDDAPQPEADVEPRGQGVNTFGYWVTNSPCDSNWTALPDLTPQCI